MGIVQSRIFGANPDNKALPTSPKKNVGIQEEKITLPETPSTQVKIQNQKESDRSLRSINTDSENSKGEAETPETVEKVETEKIIAKTEEINAKTEEINAKLMIIAKKEEIVTNNEESVLIETDENIASFVDPRSPSANIERTPVAVQEQDNGSPDLNNTPLREKTSKTGDNLRRRALMKKIAIPTTSIDQENSENQENQENLENLENEENNTESLENNTGKFTERPSLAELPGTPRPGEMSLLAGELEKMGINSPAVR